MDGTLDTTYGTNGGWTPGTFSTTSSYGSDQVLDSAGRTVIVGYTYASDTYELIVARYTVDGILDTTFGTNGSGYTTTGFYTGEASYGLSLILDSTGRILVVGRSWNLGPTSNQKLILARYTANGILDTTFGTGGWTATQFYTNRGSDGQSLILDSSGRIIVTGTTVNLANTNTQLVVARYTANGILDPTFGTGGFTDTAFYPGQAEGSYQLVLDSTERIVVNGYTKNLTSGFIQLLVARYTANGILDPTFGTGGFTSTTFYTGESSDTGSNSLVLDSTERIILIGTTKDSTSGSEKLLVVRYTANGILDPTFGSSSGWTLTTFNTLNGSLICSLVLDSTGRILVTTNTFNTQSVLNELIVARYSANGSLDPIFGSNGGFTATTFYPGSNESGNSLVLDSTGQIIILGGTSNKITNNLILTRFTANGILDTTYGTNGGWTPSTFGTVIDNLSLGSGIVIDSEGRTIVTGNVSGLDGVQAVLIARYTTGGILDTTFGSDGSGWTATVFVPGVPQGGVSLVLDSKGRIIVTGSVGTTQQLLVARYTANGILDTTFGSSSGWTPINSNSYSGKSVVVDSTDRIIISASSDGASGSFASDYVLLYRFTANGILDPTFGTNGSTTTTFYPGKTTSGYSLTLDSTNRIIVCGYTQSSKSDDPQVLLLIARYSVDGILDTTFGNSDGFTVTEFVPGKPSFGRSLVLDSTDRIIVTGSTSDSKGFYLRSVFARYTKNGILDTTFGTSGGFTISTFNPSFNTDPNKILLDRNGMIITCGSVIDSEGRTQLLVAKYTSDGLVDTTFGTSGSGWTGTTFIPSKDSYGTCLVLDSKGRIIVTGFTNKLNGEGIEDNNLIVARYLNHVDTPSTSTTTEPICLPAGTPILTDQGTFPIEQLDPKKHTINHKSIVAITKTITPEKHLICFEANSVGINFPTKRTLMTPGHEVLYKGKLVQAKHFVGRLGGVHTVPYNGKDVLYNVLQRQHGLMVVNNMVVETLHPENKVAREILEKL